MFIMFNMFMSYQLSTLTLLQGSGRLIKKYTIPQPRPFLLVIVQLEGGAGVSA